MSRVHLSFINIGVTDSYVNYRIVTPDFNNEGTIEEIGQIKIDRILHTYEFTPTNFWINYHFIPPWVNPCFTHQPAYAFVSDPDSTIG
nr:hypothetical protein [uncultured Nitrosomonas sp.]